MEDADWRAVCAVKTGIVAAVIQETVRIRTGVRTENVRLKRISGTVTSVISSAEKACWGKSNLMVLHCLSEGVVYHRDGIIGDYDDFDDVEELIRFIKTGEK